MIIFTKSKDKYKLQTMQMENCQYWLTRISAASFKLEIQDRAAVQHHKKTDG